MTFFGIQTSFQDHSAIPRSLPIQTLSLGTPSAGSIINATNEVITLRHTSSGRKEVSLFSSSESQDRTSRRLWRSQLPIPRQETDVTLTAILPLEYNSLIFGYSGFCDPLLLALSDVYSSRRWPPPTHLLFSTG